MSFVRLPRPFGAYRSEMIQMGGINYSSQAKPGDMSESYGISTHRYPYLSTRWGRQKDVPAGDTTAIFAWDGHKVRVTGGVLFYDDKPLDNVLPGEKQFAVVNTKLVIWPDKAFIDITNGTFGSLNAETDAFNAAFSANSVTADIDNPYKKDVVPSLWSAPTSKRQPGFYTYGKDPLALEWSAETGWTLPEGTLKGIWQESGQSFPRIDTGDVIIPTGGGAAFGFAFANLQAGEAPDVTRYNNEGFYGVITAFYPDRGGYLVSFDVYNVTFKNSLFSGVYKVGDVVTISGTPGGACDKEHIEIKGVTDTPNALAFPDDTFPVVNPKFYMQAKTAYVTQEYALKAADKEYYKFTPKNEIIAGAYVYVGGADGLTVYIWDSEKKEVIEKQTAEKTTDAPSASVIPVSPFLLPDTSVKISKGVPDLDYICESGNRLWGVSSEKRTIYASALGDPSNFWQLSTSSVNSWQAAVGSEGKFTGICKLGRADVCCWKENMLHKVAGMYAPFDVLNYPLDGVQDGSYKSLQIVNGTLMYLGTHGVYAYQGGGSPVLVSSNFGERIFKNGVAGTDGDTYYISVQEGEKSHLFLYETRPHVWVREDSIRAVDWARIGRDLYMLEDDGTVWDVTTYKDAPFVDWMARFSPIYETIYGRKSHTQLIIRAEVPEHSSMTVSVRRDSGKWETCAEIKGKTNDAISVRLPMGRCDKFEIQLSGHGACTILSIARRFRVSSDK